MLLGPFVFILHKVGGNPPSSQPSGTHSRPAFSPKAEITGAAPKPHVPFVVRTETWVCVRIQNTRGRQGIFVHGSV